MVLTNSFHGTVFSIILGANNFSTYIAPSNNRGSRIVDLLDTYGLSNHLLLGDLSRHYSELASLSINREHVVDVMNSQQKQSRKFLKHFY